MTAKIADGLNVAEKNMKKSEFEKTISETLQALDKKNLSIIIHDPCFPSISDEDTGIGSSNSNGAKKLVRFLSGMCFNSIQLGPGGKIKSVDPSPYTSTVFSKNPLAIDLKNLTEERWSAILSVDTFNSIVKNAKNFTEENPKYESRAIYKLIFDEQERALKEAFTNFKKLIKAKNQNVLELNEKFTAFKNENSYWLEKDALYEALSVKHKNDYWPIWNDDLDKYLFAGKFSAKEVEDRILEVKKDYNQDYTFYEFCQFVAFEQIEETKEFNKKYGVRTIADRQVALSDRDWWAYQALFLPGVSLGVPPDYFSKTGQAWGFPVLDPDKMFTEDGNPGEAGKLLKAIFKKIFRENPGGVRIDHVIGLIDPWVYFNGKSPMSEKGARRLYSSPESTDFGKYAKINIKDIDSKAEPEDEERVVKLTNTQIEKYAEILTKIVIKAAQEEGIEKDQIICEDLGTLTYPVCKVLEKLQLSGLRVTQFVDPTDEEDIYIGKNVEPRHWITPGTHDNESIISWASNLFKNKEELEPHVKLLAEELVPEGSCRNEFIDKISNSKSEFINAKFAELFASPAQNIQVFFTDIFGMKERYNVPGDSSDRNWSLRLPNNFEELYYNNINKNKGLNFPLVLKMAIESKGKDFVSEHIELIKKLDKLSK